MILKSEISFWDQKGHSIQTSSAFLFSFDGGRIQAPGENPVTNMVFKLQENFVVMQHC